MRLKMPSEMKRVMIPILITMIISVSSCRTGTQKTSAETATSGENVEQVLMQMEREWSAAPYKRDVATLERIIADDWIAFTWDGETITKTQVIADAKSGANTAESVNLEGMKVRVFGDAAIVTGGVTEKSQYQGRNMSGHYLWTDVFVKRNGRWQAVASQTTRVGEPKS
jgi:ketosteroid isomerase-like protein